MLPPKIINKIINKQSSLTLYLKADDVQKAIVNRILHSLEALSYFFVTLNFEACKSTHN
jgi:hypothetical protein